MMNIKDLPVAKRTRLQRQLLDQGYCGALRNQCRKRKRETGFHEVFDVDDDYWVKKRPVSSHIPVKDAVVIIEDDDDDDDEEEKEETDDDRQTFVDGNYELSEDELHSCSEIQNDLDLISSLLNKRPYHIETNNQICWGKETNHLEKEMKMNKTDENKMDGNCSDDHEVTSGEEKANDGFITIDESNEEESDSQEFSDDGFVIIEEQEDSYANLQNNTKTSSLQSTEDDTDDEDDLFGSSESESDDSEDSDFSLVKRRPHRPTQNNKEKVWSGSSTRKDNNPSIHKTKTKSTDQKPFNESSGIIVHEKQTAKSKLQDHYMKDGKQYRVKYKKSKLRDDAGCVDAILESIISNEDVHDKRGDACLPLKFRFADCEDDSSSRITDESNGEELFKEMDLLLKCEEIGSYGIPKDVTRVKDACNDNIDLCKRGEHGDIFFEEQTGLRCGLCGAVVLESRYVISKLANYAPDKARRSNRFDEQEFCSLEDPYSIDSNSNRYDICAQTKGTVWELIPINIQKRMYPHQKEGFEFLWKNLTGTTELSTLRTTDPRKGGGCIISHAPGTGKTFLTIVFMESFLKKFPKCCPVIVAPASMLLTWEDEFKKWQVGISFINLHNTEVFKREQTVSGSAKHTKDIIRALKIRRWANGGSVLGVSYNLYEKLTRNSGKQNMDYEKVRKILLDMPRLVVLDEGHTPRNQHSNIWNTLLKLKTKNRVILSGTPFQNNFRELFNTLHLVRPKTAKSIVKEKVFADMIQPKKMKISKGRSSSDDIEKLKVIISPFVHVHKGYILESNLPGLKQSVVLLNPPPFQKSFIENVGNSAGTFEYEHKVALVSVHPSLILHCALSKKEESSINKQELEDVRLQPEVGVKTRFVMELIRLSVSLNEKVLIFSQYIQPSELLKDQIARTFGWEDEKEIAVIKGKINQTRRQKIINVFNDPRSELKVLLASTRCCSEGIHLYGGSRVVLLDVVWNPSVERQAISRAYRLGQEKVVYTYHLMAAGTTEEEKYDRQVEKWRVAEMVFSSASMDRGESKNNKVNVDDKILQAMVDNQELKEIFRKIRYPENHTRI